MIKLMQKRTVWGVSRSLLLAVLAAVCIVVPAYAQTSSSNNYKASEMQFGAGSSNESCSGNYCARASIGDIAGGESKSVSNSAVFGPVAPSEPSLDMIIDTGNVNLGVLTTEVPATKTATMKVRTYLTDGYTLQITGDPPKYANHTLATPATPTASTPGTEQFGINLVANTVPNVGVNPVQVPSGEFSFGSVLPNYSTPNRFMYSSGDVVARSPTQTGQTDYTVSFIINISNATPAGQFKGEYSAVIIPIF